MRSLFVEVYFPDHVSFFRNFDLNSSGGLCHLLKVSNHHPKVEIVLNLELFDNFEASQVSLHTIGIQSESTKTLDLFLYPGKASDSLNVNFVSSSPLTGTEIKVKHNKVYQERIKKTDPEVVKKVNDYLIRSCFVSPSSAEKRLLLEAKYPNVCQLAYGEDNYQLSRLINDYINNNIVYIDIDLNE